MNTASKSRKKRGEEFTEFKNKDNKLPKYNKDGTPAKYTEHDYQKPPTPEQRANGADRGKKRVVISNDGTSYYTNDHYDSFESGVCQHSCHPYLNQATKTSLALTRLDRRTGLRAVG